MYLVELKLGKEELYRTGDDLALAIRDGDVDARSRIYHRATAKWISITLHPQYKAIVAGQKDEQISRPTRKRGDYCLPVLPGFRKSCLRRRPLRLPAGSATGGNGRRGLEWRESYSFWAFSSPSLDRAHRGRAGARQWRSPAGRIDRRRGRSASKRPEGQRSRAS